MKITGRLAIPTSLLTALLLCVIVLPRALGGEVDLKSKWWPTGSALDLQRMEAKDIEKIRIFRLEWPGGGIIEDRKEELAEKHYTERPLAHPEDTEEMEGLLRLLKRAGRWKMPAPGIQYEPIPPDRVLVVQPVQGEPFEVLYSSHFHEPFGELYSLELKEALFALSGGSTRISVIYFDRGEVQRVIHSSAIAPHTGGAYWPDIAADMSLSPEKGLSLYVRVRDGRKTVMEDEKAMHYGDAKVFKSGGPGSYIVLLHKP